MSVLVESATLALPVEPRRHRTSSIPTPEKARSSGLLPVSSSSHDLKGSLSPTQSACGSQRSVTAEPPVRRPSLSRSHSAPKDRPSTADAAEPSRLVVEDARPSLQVGRVTGSSSMMALSSHAAPCEDDVAHSRSKSLSAGVKTLARKASGKLRLLASRQSGTETPPMPDAAEQEEALRQLTLSTPKTETMELPEGSSDGERKPPSTPASPHRKGSTPASPHRKSSTSSRKNSQTRTRGKALPRSESDGDFHRRSTRHRTSSPTAFFKKGLEDDGEKRLSKKKSSPSLLASASSGSIFHLGKHEPPPPPLITPFLIDVQEMPSKLDWPPKRQSSMPPKVEAASEPSLATSLATLSALSTPIEHEGPRVRFPSSFGFVTGPEQDVPELPYLKVSPAASAVPTARMAFEDLLNDSDVVVRKTCACSLLTFFSHSEQPYACYDSKEVMIYAVFVKSAVDVSRLFVACTIRCMAVAFFHVTVSHLGVCEQTRKETSDAASTVHICAALRGSG